MPRATASHLPILVLLTAATTWLSGCGEGDGQGRDGEVAADVELLDPGAEPRRPLAIDAGAGARQSVEVEVGMTMGLDLDGESIPAETIPATSTTLDFELLEHSHESRVLSRVVLAGAAIVDLGSDLERLKMVNSQFQRQDPVGRKGTILHGRNRGVVEVDFPIPAGASPILRHYFGNVRQALRQLTVPLPDEPIGAGARWSASEPLEMTGMRLTQNANYELKELAEDRAVVAVQADLYAEPQLLELPNMPPGARCELLSLEGRAHGDLTLVSGAPFPTAGELVYELRLQVRVLVEKQERHMNSRIDMSFRLDSR